VEVESSVTHGGEADASTVGSGAWVEEQVGATLVGLALFGGGDELVGNESHGRSGGTSGLVDLHILQASL